MVTNTDTDASCFSALKSRIKLSFVVADTGARIGATPLPNINPSLSFPKIPK